ncbi:hypothetical protein KKE34_01830 [Patescibacteria group bacterium]|nr:hypothetical protein [Patescibacteria group bacterium]MBU1885327.1 hypothetical protein [Patescibacteria group bacterium]
MNNYNNNRSGRSQGGRRFEDRGQGRSRFGSQNSGRSQMHDAICSDCGNNCQVPFMPSSGKPIYCSDCFEKRRNSGSNTRRPNTSSRRSFSAPNSRPQENFGKQFETINAKLDIILKAIAPQQEEIKAEVKKTKKKKSKIKKVAKTESVKIETKKIPEAEIVTKTEVLPETQKSPELEVTPNAEVAIETEVIPQAEEVPETEEK